MPMPTQHTVGQRAEIVVPVHHQVKKLVQPCQDRRDGEADVQDLVRLIHRIVYVGGMTWRGLGGNAAGRWMHCMSHKDLQSRNRKYLLKQSRLPGRNKSTFDLTYSFQYSSMLRKML